MKILILLICISSVYTTNYVEDPTDNGFGSKWFEDIEGFNAVAVAPNSFPFTVSIQIHQDDVFVNNCAGVILTADRVLTTAQCLRGATFVVVIAGVHNRDINENNQQRRTVTRANFNVHPQYDDNRLNNIALLNIATPFTLNTVVRIATLPNEVDEETFAGQIGRTLSWARVSGQTQSSSVLRSLLNNIITNEDCERFFAAGFVFHSTICVSTSAANGNFCGTSVLTAERSGTVVIGLTDFIPPSCGAGIPFGFVRLSSFVTWINKQLL